MCKKINLKETWFPSNGTHNNIFNKYRNKFYNKIHDFLYNLRVIKNNEETVINKFPGDSINYLVPQFKYDESYMDHPFCIKNSSSIKLNKSQKIIIEKKSEQDLKMDSSANYIKFLSNSPCNKSKLSKSHSVSSLNQSSPTFNLDITNLENEYNYFIKLNKNYN